MQEITSNDLRRKGSEILDQVLKGERLFVTRNGRTVGALIPIDDYYQLNEVSIAELAHVLKIRPKAVLDAVYALIETEGRDQVVYRDLGGSGATGLRLFGTAGVKVYDSLAQPGQELPN